jgi:hypothetical protein
LANPKFIEPKFFNASYHYGCFKAVEKFTKKRFSLIRDYVEHGVIFIEDIESVKRAGYVDRKFIKRIYTFGEWRKAMIEKFLESQNIRNLKVFAIGPYISGVDFFKSIEELVRIKKEFGKTLVVFPSHSIEALQSNYDLDEFVTEIQRVKKERNFNTVLICLYWADIIIGRDVFYLEKGFKVVTNGHRSDPYFLNRQKDLLYLADHTMSNNIGSYIGYSIFMKKPHYLYKQNPQYMWKDSNQELKQPMSHYEALDILQKVFGSFSSEITEEQLQVVEKYWGKWENENNLL